MQQLPTDTGIQVQNARQQYEEALKLARTPLAVNQTQTLFTQTSPGAFLAGIQGRQQYKQAQKQYEGEVAGAQNVFETSVAKAAPEYGKTEYVEAEYKAAMATVTDKINYFQDKINKINDKINKINADTSLKSTTRNERITNLQEDKKEYVAQQKAWNELAGKDKATIMRGMTTGQVEDLASYYKEKVEANRQQKQFIEQQKQNIAGELKTNPDAVIYYDNQTPYILKKPTGEVFTKQELSQIEYFKDKKDITSSDIKYIFGSVMPYYQKLSNVLTPESTASISIIPQEKEKDKTEQAKYTISTYKGPEVKVDIKNSDSYSMTVNGIPVNRYETRAVEVGTGKVAKEAGLTTQTANLEDHLFIEVNGEMYDMGLTGTQTIQRNIRSSNLMDSLFGKTMQTSKTEIPQDKVSAFGEAKVKVKTEQQDNIPDWMKTVLGPNFPSSVDIEKQYQAQLKYERAVEQSKASTEKFNKLLSEGRIPIESVTFTSSGTQYLTFDTKVQADAWSQAKQIEIQGIPITTPKVEAQKGNILSTVGGITSSFFPALSGAANIANWFGMGEGKSKEITQPTYPPPGPLIIEGTKFLSEKELEERGIIQTFPNIQGSSIPSMPGAGERNYIKEPIGGKAIETIINLPSTLRQLSYEKGLKPAYESVIKPTSIWGVKNIVEPLALAPIALSGLAYEKD